MNRYFHRGVCRLCLILVSFSVFPVFATAPKTAKIVFTSTRDGNSEIYIMDVDGSGQKNLTQHHARDESPVWSPTGGQIAFHSDRHGLRDIYIMDPDGRNVQKLFKDLVYREYPTWSPDGAMLAYHRSDGVDRAIYVADINKGKEERLARTGPLAGFPAWSPDGSEIVFTFRSEDALGQTVLRTVDVNTREDTVLFQTNESASLTRAAWSPEGDKIAFYWLKKGIYILNRKTREAKKVITGSTPAWSPQGDELLYNKNRKLFKFNIALRRLEQLTAGNSFDGSWFDPTVLPVQPGSELLTTSWGKLKQE